MKTKEDYIQILHSSEKELSEYFGIRTIRLFGSVARGQHTATSDIDICVETDTPNPFLLMDAKEYLQKLLNCPVDVVRYRTDMNPYLKRRIDKEGIYVLR